MCVPQERDLCVARDYTSARMTSDCVNCFDRCGPGTLLAQTKSVSDGRGLHHKPDVLAELYYLTWSGFVSVCKMTQHNRGDTEYAI